MPHPVIHAEVRSEDPDATREFFAQLFDWKVASEGGFPGYTFMDTGVPGWHRGGDQSSPGREWTRSCSLFRSKTLLPP